MHSLGCTAVEIKEGVGWVQHEEEKGVDRELERGTATNEVGVRFIKGGRD